MKKPITFKVTFKEGQMPPIAIYLIWRLNSEPTHGYELIEEIGRNPIVPSLRPSTIYMVLASLERDGLIRSAPKLIGNRVRKIYSSTKKGIRVFRKARVEFAREKRFCDFLRALLKK